MQVTDLEKIQAQIEKLAQQRHRHWAVLSTDWSPLRVERISKITAELNGHTDDWCFHTRRDGGMYELKRAARAALRQMGGTRDGAVSRL